MWERYCRGVNAIVFVVDSANLSHIPGAKIELVQLLEKSQLRDIPLLVLGNKNDLEGALSVEELIEQLYKLLTTLNLSLSDLKSINDREVCCYSISAKNNVNIDITMSWLMKHAKK